MDQFDRLLDIMATLRSPEGCPWDREQTIDSLKPFVLEEAYEVVDAIDRHDHAALAEELGDFVLQAVFLAQLESEAGQFTIADSLDAISDKLVRRHPHVFKRHEGEARLESAGQVRTRWEEIKAQERGGATNAAPKTLLSGIPASLPALLRAYHIGVRAASVHFDWTRVEDVVQKMQEEVNEIREVVAAERPLDHDRAEEEVGDLLFAIAQLARQLKIDPETALRKANDKFTTRFTTMEQAIAASGRSMRDMGIEDLEREWQLAKLKKDVDRRQDA
jgi:tetrapyrrole methylase family protein / MazG family protein